MVGKCALRSMRAPVCAGYTIDILVRTTQLFSIHKAFIQSGRGFKKPGPVRSKFLAAAKAARCPGKAARCPENQKLSAKGQSA
ncbi:hypothetical protein HOY82DRAFT_597514 [Tuber indicum]|nr:hypothetical protein HOY82DRAFT_597514 [Tuber indicum]